MAKDLENLLAIDIGNTNLAIGFFQNGKLTEHWRLSTDHKRMQDEYGLQFLGVLDHAGIDTASISGLVISSVVPPLTDKVAQACTKYLGLSPLIVQSDLKLNVKIG
jgi:type III pantothenate kinase